MKSLLENSKYANFEFLFKNSKNLMLGKYFSKLKGEGVEFCDLKVYDFTDDVRKIDWNVTARANEVFVREYLEEKDVSHYFLIDISGSVFNKISQIRNIVSTLILSCSKFSDNYSIILCKKDFLKVVPLSKGKRHLIKCIYELSQIKEEGYSDLESGVDFLLSRVKKSSVISILSDELEFSELFLSKIKALKRKNKVVFFEFFNSSELEFDLGLDVFCDSESGEEVMYDLDDDEVYEIILNFNNKLNNCKKIISKTGVKFFCLDCKFDTVTELSRGGYRI